MKTNILLKKYTIVIVIMVIALTGILTFVIFNHPKTEMNAVQISNTDASEIKDALNKQVEEGKINVQYQLYSVFDGRDSKEFLVRNNPNNYHPIRFKIYDENERTIYESEKILLGYEVNKIHLDKSLKKGDYDCKIEIGYDCKGNVSSRFPLKITVL